MLVNDQSLLILSLVFALGVVAAAAQGQGQSERSRREAAAGVDWNYVTDIIIGQFKQQILEKGEDEVSIPDLHESLHKRFGWIHQSTVSFTATDGHLSSLASLHRISDVIMSDNGNNMTFTALLKFANLKLRYGHYTARVAGVGPSGSIAVRVMDNSALLRVRIDVDKNGCSLMHEDVEEVTLGGIKLKVTGLGPLNGLASKIATWIAKALQDDIKGALQQLLDKELAHVLRNTDLDCTS